MKVREGEKREYFRVKDDLSLRFRELDESEFMRLCEKTECECQSIPFAERMDGFKRNAQDQFSLILEYLSSIERKLDILMAMLESRDNMENYVDGAKTIDLSASGIRFVSPVKPEKRFVELILDVPASLGKSMRVLAEIVRVKNYSSDKALWEVAAKYRKIGEKEMDALVSYLLRKEREYISSLKMDE